MIPPRTSLHFHSVPDGVSGADCIRALSFGFRSLQALATVHVYAVPYAQAGLTQVHRRGHGRAAHKVDLWLPKTTGGATEARSLLAGRAAYAAAMLNGLTGNPLDLQSTGEATAVGDWWGELTDQPLAIFCEVGGPHGGRMWGRFLSSIGLDTASHVELERKHGINRAACSRLLNGKHVLSSVTRWAGRLGYKGGLTDFVEDFWHEQ
jgi:hypothetical protein